MNAVHIPLDHTRSRWGRYGALVARRRWWFLGTYLGAVVIAAAVGMSLFGALQSGGYEAPGSESVRVDRIVADQFGVQTPVAVLALSAPAGVDATTTEQAAAAIVRDLSGIEGVEQVVSYWTSGHLPQLRSADGTTGQIVVVAREGADEATIATSIVDRTEGAHEGLTVHVGGFQPVANAITTAITEDLAKAEAIAIPITIIVLVFVFGSVVSAGLPFLVAAGSVLGSFAILYGITRLTDVSIFALNLVTGLGLALGIDYSLLIINRFREELKAGRDTADAVANTVATAGKTVFVSGLIVATTLASLVLFPQYFLKSFAYAGISAAMLAIIGALTALPAAMAILGPRVNMLKVRRGDLAPKDTGAWATISRWVMRRPVTVIIVTVTGLLIMAMPAFSAAFAEVDDRWLPASDPAAVASAFLRDEFAGSASDPYDVVLTSTPAASAIADYAVQLSELPGVVSVTTPTQVVVHGAVVSPNPESTGWLVDGQARLAVLADVAPRGTEGAALVGAIREVPAPAPALVGGAAAEAADSITAIRDVAPWVALWIAIATLVFVFLYTGSVLLPFKALVLNVLSLAATLGALVWTFQGGHLTWLTGNYVQTGTVEISIVALIAVVAFALSMDYEIFLLSRIKEEHFAGRDNTSAVAFGLQRTGRLITAAALMIAIVFASFMTSGVTGIKQMGFGVMVAILVDATVIRALLVPAFMKLAGGANWWAPPWLRRIHDRIGLDES
ncbi:MAG: MMPL family transporter [Candidatus Nanopelagicales bacterium]|nr:MMPL family transporter [Candidatus Nanopelagicales bacterium]